MLANKARQGRRRMALDSLCKIAIAKCLFAARRFFRAPLSSHCLGRSVWRRPNGSTVPRMDCRIYARSRPLVVLALASDAKTRDVTITLPHLRRWDIEFRPRAVFEDQESINRQVPARFSDACDKQFSGLETNRGRIARLAGDTLPE